MSDNRPPEPPLKVLPKTEQGRKESDQQQTESLRQKNSQLNSFSQESSSQQGFIRRQVHHTYIWMGSLRVVSIIFVVMLFTFFPTVIQNVGRESESGFLGSFLGVPILALLIILIVAMFIIQFFSYKNLFYELGPDEFSLYSGIFNKKRVHVPYQRVQSVNQQMSLIQRIFGVCTVSIDTAGGSNNKAIVVPYLLNSDAEHLRAEIFARKQAPVEQSETGTEKGAQFQLSAEGSNTAGATNVLDTPAGIISDIRGVFGGQRVETGAVSYQYGLSNKELVFTGLSNSAGALLIVFSFLGLITGTVFPIIQNMFGMSVVEQSITQVTEILAGQLLAGIIGLLVFVFAVAWIVSIIRSIILYGGFRACRRQNRIEVEHGLLQHSFHGVDIERVQSVIIRQSFIRRRIGYCEVFLGKIDAMQDAQEQQKKGLNHRGVIIHPFVKLKKVPEILEGLVPEFADMQFETRKLPSISLRRALIRRVVLKGVGFWLAVITGLSQMLFHVLIPTSNAQDMQGIALLDSISLVLYAVCVVIALLEIINAVLWYRGSDFAFNNRFFQVSNGGFSRESIFLPRKKLQFGFVKTNPLQRSAKVATINARTAVGIGGTTLRLIDVCEDDAEKWLDWLLPRQNVIK